MNETKIIQKILTIINRRRYVLFLVLAFAAGCLCAGIFFIGQRSYTVGELDQRYNSHAHLYTRMRVDEKFNMAWRTMNTNKIDDAREIYLEQRAAQSQLSAKYEKSSKFWKTFTIIAVPVTALISGGIVWALMK